MVVCTSNRLAPRGALPNSLISAPAMKVRPAQESQAPDRVVAQLERLPQGQQFRNVEEVWESLGGGGETNRF